MASSTKKPSSCNNSIAISAFSSLSSASKILLPLISAVLGCFSCSLYTSSFDTVSSEIVTVNFVPTSWLLSALMFPPISSISDFTIGRPSPVPTTLFSVDVCSLENSSNIWGRYSSLIPIPVSSQIKQYCAILSSDAISLTVTWIDFPLGVYLTALPTIFK